MTPTLLALTTADRRADTVLDPPGAPIAYDYMGRRIRKQVLQYPWNGGTQMCEAPLVIEDQRFVYDGWNVVMVLDGRDLNNDEEPDNTVMRKYTWGLDLSGQTGVTEPRAQASGPGGIHGAGGIGGLLASEEPQTVGDPKRHWFLYDGNGNVGQLLKYVAGDPPTVTLATHYEYDPYGNTIRADNADSSGVVITNPFRFSTKWLGAKIGLYYYGYRYYSPRLGRWMSRDPIGEEGGLNVYAFAINAPIDRMDPDGRIILGIGGASGIGDPGLWGTLRELRKVEVECLNKKAGCSGITDEGGIVFISNPTNTFLGILPNWDAAALKIMRAVDNYAEDRLAKKERGVCCLEPLHIVGYSDGASTIARWINSGSGGLMGDYQHYLGLVGLIDLVRYGPPLSDLPNATPNKPLFVHTFGVSTDFRAVRSTSGGWLGYEIRSAWRNTPVNANHFTIPTDGTTVSFLKEGLRRSMDVVATR